MIERKPILVDLPPHCDGEHLDVDSILQTARGRRARAESVGEADGGPMLSIGYRAESSASTEELLFPGRLRGTNHLILNLKTPGLAAWRCKACLRESIHAPK